MTRALGRFKAPSRSAFLEGGGTGDTMLLGRMNAPSVITASTTAAAAEAVASSFGYGVPVVPSGCTRHCVLGMLAILRLSTPFTHPTTRLTAESVVSPSLMAQSSASATSRNTRTIVTRLKYWIPMRKRAVVALVLMELARCMERRDFQASPATNNTVPTMTTGSNHAAPVHSLQPPQGSSRNHPGAHTWHDSPT